MADVEMPGYPALFDYPCPHPPCAAPSGSECVSRGRPIGGLHQARLRVLSAARNSWSAGVSPAPAVERVLASLARTTYTVHPDITHDAQEA